MLIWRYDVINQQLNKSSLFFQYVEKPKKRFYMLLKYCQYTPVSIDKICNKNV